MITTAVFPFQLPKVSTRYPEGKRYTLASNPVAGSTAPLKLFWYYNQNDQTGHAEIQEGSQIRYSYEEGDPLPRNMPDGLKQRIVDDYNALLGKTEEEKVEEQKETTSTVREETVNGTLITMTRTENTFDIRGGEDKILYTVRAVGSPTMVFDTQEEAEERFDNLVDFYTPKSQTSTVFEEEYRGVNIRYQETINPDGTRSELSSVFLSGEIVEEFPIGQEVSFRDQYGVQDFGTLTPDNALEILKAYIDARLDPRPDPNAPEEEYGLLPLYSWGWYRDNNDDPNCPFSDVYLENVYTVSETNGRILGLTDDDFIAQGIQSGLVKLKVKDGYRVRLKLMTQNRGFLEDNIPDLDSVGIDFETYNITEAKVFGQSTNYTDTEKVKIDLFGGDELEINIDGQSGEPSVKKFYITQNGSQITSGGGATINDETFLAVIEVERYAPGEEEERVEESTTSTTTGNVLALVIGGGLILAILYMVLARGDDE